MVIFTFYVTKLTLNNLYKWSNCNRMNFREIYKNRSKVRFSKMLQNSTLSSQDHKTFTCVFLWRFLIKTVHLWFSNIQFMQTGVQPKNHKPENQTELMGVPLKAASIHGYHAILTLIVMICIHHCLSNLIYRLLILRIH